MQPGHGKNYFELFELPVQFDIDVADLNARYRKLQQQFHPDRYASGSDQEQRMAMELTASINEGLRILKDPVNRGRYMLELSGVSVDQESDTVMDPAFLVEQMELRERLDGIQHVSNATAAIIALSREVDQLYRRRVDELANELNAGGEMQKARSIVRELQFLQKLRAQIEETEEILM
jgi:molecular chaperone HscB